MRTHSPSPTRPRKQLWGIYHAGHSVGAGGDRPLRTVIEAPSQLVAEETAARLGFGDPHAIAVTPEQAEKA